MAHRITLLALYIVASSVFFAGEARAEDDERSVEAIEQKVDEMLDGIKLVPKGAVNDRRCRGQWREDKYCKIIWAASIKFRNKDYLESIRFAAAVLRDKPRSRRAYKYVGRSLVKIVGGSRFCPKARPYLERAAHATEGHDALSDYLWCSRFYDMSSDERRDIIRIARVHAEIGDGEWDWWMLARLFANLGEYRLARQYAPRITAAEPNSPAAWEDRAVILADAESLSDAIEAQKKALALRMEDREFDHSEPRVFDLRIQLANFLWEAGRTEESLQVVRRLNPEDENDRLKAYQLEIQLILQTHRTPAVPEKVKELAMKHEAWPKYRLAFDLIERIQDGTLADMPPPLVAKHSVGTRLRRHLILGDNDAAREVVRQWVRAKGWSADVSSWVEEIAFRRRDCGALSRGEYLHISSRFDKADIWRETLRNAAWQHLCTGNYPTGDYNPSPRDRPSRQRRAKTLYAAASAFARWDYREAEEIFSGLGEDQPPVTYQLGMWIAAARGDLAKVADRHRLTRNARTYSDWHRLAFVLAHLARGDADAARQTYEALPQHLRAWPVLRTRRLVLVYRIIERAVEIDPDFAAAMAEKWVRGDGPYERWIFQKLEETDTQLASRP